MTLVSSSYADAIQFQPVFQPIAFCFYPGLDLRRPILAKGLAAWTLVRWAVWRFDRRIHFRDLGVYAGLCRD